MMQGVSRLREMAASAATTTLAVALVSAPAVAAMTMPTVAAQAG